MPVPADLLIPFGEFATKYSLESLMPTMWRSAQGIGNILELPTLYVIKYVGGPLLEAFQIGFQTTAAYDNSVLYDSAARVLGENVFYNTTVLSGARGSTGADLVIKTNGQTILVKSQKLIISMQPTLENMQPFDLNPDEKSIFGQFKSNEYFCGILNNTGIPSNVSVVNIDFTQPYGLPRAPTSSAFLKLALRAYNSLLIYQLRLQSKAKFKTTFSVV